MCAVSALSSYGSAIDNWTVESLDAFKTLLDAAVKFDEDTKQPKCEDPKKLLWLEVAESKVNE